MDPAKNSVKEVSPSKSSEESPDWIIASISKDSEIDTTSSPAQPLALDNQDLIENNTNCHVRPIIFLVSIVSV